MSLNDIINKVIDASEEGDFQALEKLLHTVQDLLVDEETRETYTRLINKHIDLIEEIADLLDSQED